MEDLYHLDLFSGIGGFGLASKMAGFRFRQTFFSEIDAHAIEVYKRHFPDALPVGDIKKLSAATLPQGRWLVTSGFPCQDISGAGKRRGINAERSGLWWECCRLIGEIRPEFALLENVRALCGRGLANVLAGLAECGYDAEWQVLSARAAGAPHLRERVFIVAYPGSHRRPAPEGQAQAENPGLGEDNDADATSSLALPWTEGARIYASRELDGQPILRRMDDELSARMDCCRLKALGNAIVPACAAPILRRIKAVMG